MTLRVLVVCTANVCRSPVVERLLARELTAAGVDAHVTSAGTRGGRNTVDAETLRAARAVDIDVSAHSSRPLTARAIADDGADLVIAMTREHVREIVALDASAWSRTFTLKELARKLGEVAPAETLSERIAAMSAGRQPADLLGSSDDDDVADPYGGPRQGYAEMMSVVDSLSRTIARSLTVGPRTV